MFNKSGFSFIYHSCECTLVQLHVVCTYCDVYVSTIGLTPFLAIWIIVDRSAAQKGLCVSGKGKVHPCTGAEALYRPVDP